MLLEKTTVWFGGMTKRSLANYAKHTELPCDLRVSHQRNGQIRISAFIGGGSDSFETALIFSSPAEMRRMARMFSAAADLREAMEDEPNGPVSGPRKGE